VRIKLVHRHHGYWLPLPKLIWGGVFLPLGPSWALLVKL
jgi:hypothetical protein